MDLLSQHEAFLRAIFDAPEDDTQRLVYADFLQENGEEDRAAFIRWQCGRGEKPERMPINAPNGYWRGLPWGRAQHTLHTEDLLDADALRREAVRQPDLFGVMSLTFSGGRITSGDAFDVLFGLAAFARVTELILVGEEVPDDPDAEAGFTTYTLRPVITTVAVAALAQHLSQHHLRAAAPAVHVGRIEQRDAAIERLVDDFGRAFEVHSLAEIVAAKPDQRDPQARLAQIAQDHGHSLKS